nr:MAG TPA: hypothetical protein [Caudoviricetes sp.]DAV70149.1 MAG TPA: hypothetical protein [Caudoviricetes sp.]
MRNFYLTWRLFFILTVNFGKTSGLTRRGTGRNALLLAY